MTQPRDRAGGRSFVAGCAFAALVLAGVLAISFFGVYRLRGMWLPAVGQALVVTPSVRSADVIIVLGGGDGDRSPYAAQLYNQRLAPHVIATGAPDGTTAQQTPLVKLGVPTVAITLANGTQNTEDDAQHCLTLMREYGWQSAILVTDPYHSRRSLWTFRTAFAATSIAIWPAPVPDGWFDASTWWRTEDGFVAVNEEYLKLAYYLARGYIRLADIA